MNTPTSPQRPVDLSEESVAGEEDPGASIELAQEIASLRTKPAPDAATAAPAATDDGNDFCRACGGDGMLNGGPCPDCNGTGKAGMDQPD